MPNTVVIHSKEAIRQPQEDAEVGFFLHWYVNASVQTGTGLRSGGHVVELPEDASDAQIKTALLAQYGA